MNKLSFIFTFILFNTVYTRQIGSIVNHVLTYEPPVDNSLITTILFDNSSSCNACICAAFMSESHYVAINCFKDNHTCSLFTLLVDITGTIPSQNTTLYILSYISIPLTHEDESTDSSSETTATPASTTSFPTTTMRSTTAMKASLDNLTDATTATRSSVSILTVTAKTITMAITTTIRTTTTTRATTTTHTRASTTARCKVWVNSVCISYG